MISSIKNIQNCSFHIKMRICFIHISSTVCEQTLLLIWFFLFIFPWHFILFDTCINSKHDKKNFKCYLRAFRRIKSCQAVAERGDESPAPLSHPHSSVIPSCTASDWSTSDAFSTDEFPVILVLCCRCSCYSVPVYLDMSRVLVKCLTSLALLLTSLACEFSLCHDQDPVILLI